MEMIWLGIENTEYLYNLIRTMYVPAVYSIYLSEWIVFKTLDICNYWTHTAFKLTQYLQPNPEYASVNQHSPLE